MNKLLKLTMFAFSFLMVSQIEASRSCPSGSCAPVAPGSQVDPSGHGCSLDGGYMWCPGSQSCARTCRSGFWSGYES